MKQIAILSILVSSLLAGLHETNVGLFLEVYEKHDRQSRIIAEVSTEKGTLEKLRCRGVRTDQWCKVRYKNDGVILEGWSDKASLDFLASQRNTKPTFERRFGGRYSDEGHALLAVEDGFLIAGSSESFGMGQRDGYLLRTDSFGNKVWSKSYGGGRDDTLEAIIPFKEGYAMAGSTYSFGNGNQNLYVVRVGSEGELVWERGFYDRKRDRYMGKSLVRHNEEHLMIAGSQEHIKLFNGDTYCYLSAIDAQGEKKWQRSYGGKDPERANSIVKVKDGYVFAGYTETWGDDGKNMYVVKIDDHGRRLWHYAYGGEFDEVAHQVIATNDGGYLLVGTTNSDHNKLKDVYVVKLDAQGKWQWKRHYGGRSDEEGFGVVEDESGYVIVGYTKSTKDLSSDLYLLKLDYKGVVQWVRTYGGSGNDVGRAIIKTEDGFVMTGYSDGPSDRGVDLYLLKVDKEGRL